MRGTAWDGGGRPRGMEGERNDSDQVRNDDVRQLRLTLSSRQEKGRKERKNGGRNEAEDSGMQNGGRKDMREDEEQGR